MFFLAQTLYICTADVLILVHAECLFYSKNWYSPIDLWDFQNKSFRCSDGLFIRCIRLPMIHFIELHQLRLTMVSCEAKLYAMNE